MTKASFSAFRFVILPSSRAGRLFESAPFILSQKEIVVTEHKMVGYIGLFEPTENIKIDVQFTSHGKNLQKSEEKRGAK